MSEYNTVGGIVAFEPVKRETSSGQKVTDVIIGAIGAKGATVKITLWPEFGKVKVSEGDFVVANGKFSSDDVNGKIYHNLSASRLVVNGTPVTKVEEEAVEEENAQESLF